MNTMLCTSNTRFVGNIHFRWGGFCIFFLFTTKVEETLVSYLHWSSYKGMANLFLLFFVRFASPNYNCYYACSRYFDNQKYIPENLDIDDVLHSFLGVRYSWFYAINWSNNPFVNFIWPFDRFACVWFNYVKSFPTCMLLAKEKMSSW